MGNKKSTKIAALIALIAILGSVVGTGILVLVETFSNTTQEKTLTPDELNELFKIYSGSLTQTGAQEVASGVTNTVSGETLTGTSK